MSQHYAEGLIPSSPADRVTLARRVYLDLLGLPPTPAQVDAFVNDPRPGAWERLVDGLLTSPHYGERMAIYWLDVVRYADSNGYHSDEARQIAPYRDYVIESFNRNLRFDRFVTEQLAGDLLPQANPVQKVASGFNMLLQTTSEGGAQAKEYLAKYSADRVRNTSSIFLGVTLGCAQCHDHKYDPFTMRVTFTASGHSLLTSRNGASATHRPTPSAWAPSTAPSRTVETRIARLNKTLADHDPRVDTSTDQVGGGGRCRGHPQAFHSHRGPRSARFRRRISKRPTPRPLRPNRESTCQRPTTA